MRIVNSNLSTRFGCLFKLFRRNKCDHSKHFTGYGTYEYEDALTLDVEYLIRYQY